MSKNLIIFVLISECCLLKTGVSVLRLKPVFVIYSFIIVYVCFSSDKGCDPYSILATCYVSDMFNIMATLFLRSRFRPTPLNSVVYLPVRQ